MLPHKPPYNILQFINILPLQNICTFRDMDPFLYPYPIFSALQNLNFLTSQTQKFKFHKFLPRALSPTQNELKKPKRSWINPYFDYETGVDILLEDPAYRWLDFAHSNFACFFQKLTNRTKLLKSPKNITETKPSHTKFGAHIVDGIQFFDDVKQWSGPFLGDLRWVAGFGLKWAKSVQAKSKHL